MISAKLGLRTGLVSGIIKHATTFEQCASETTSAFITALRIKKIVGIAQVVQTAFPDATAEEGDWSAVTLVPLTPLKVSVTLAQIKQDELLQNIALVRQSRLSVSPLSSEEFKQILKLSETRLP